MNHQAESQSQARLSRNDGKATNEQNFPSRIETEGNFYNNLNYNPGNCPLPKPGLPDEVGLETKKQVFTICGTEVEVDMINPVVPN